ncbi:hypothetical protein [Bdellovibrio bacteriovorus]|uniref:hypothetical protein n=1 Tax=Bdellovibrio bacteriovorus TaxID=959 RepID=UPI0035A8BA2B
MLHFITAAVLVFTSSHALAQDEGEKVPVKEGYETLDMSEYQAFEKTKVPSKKGGTKFSTSCKDITGAEFKQGEAGYETCLGQVKPGKSSDKEPGNSMNVNMDLGD